MRFTIFTALAAALSLAVTAEALAASRGAATGATRAAPPTTAAQPTTLSPAHMTGQPNQNCATAPGTPGNAASAPGSAFNPAGTAGKEYAGQETNNSRNTASVSQYDVACSHQR